MRNLKIIVSLIMMIFSFNTVHSQSNHLDVEGNVKIRGNIDIHQINDNTSLFIGTLAGLNYDSIANGNNTFIGSRSGQLNVSATDNTFIGYKAGRNTTEGGDNTFVGSLSGAFNDSGILNVLIGSRAGHNNIGGSSNSFLGDSAGFNNKNGSFNSFFGDEAGSVALFGNYNTFIGASSGPVSHYDTLESAIALGYNAKANCSNCAIIGGVEEDAVHVGIGVDSPTIALMMLERDAMNPVGITQNQLGGGSSMELTTQDSNGLQATRLLLKGNTANNDVEFYRGDRGSEILTMHIEGNNGNIGIDILSPTEKLDVNGNARIRSVGSGIFNSSLNITPNGTLTTSTSDRRLKENISDLENSLNKVLALRGVSYQWKRDEQKEKRIGLIAQEVNEVVPELVFTNQSDGYMGVRYQEVVALLIEAIKTHHFEISTLKTKVASLLEYNTTQKHYTNSESLNPER